MKEMPKPPEDEEIEYTPYNLMRSERAAIGDIITTGAQLEHVISMAFFAEMSIEPIDGLLLFGKSPISNRIIALKTALRYKKESSEKFDEFKDLEKQLKEFVALRNMFAHGALMGIRDGILHYMVTLDPSQEDLDTVVFKMRRIRLVEFAARAQQGKILLDNMRRIFNVTTLHERHVLRVASKKSRGP